MKKGLLGTACMMFVLAGPDAAAQTTTNGNHTLVAYFSWSGNTRKVAKQIAELAGGDLFEIQTVKAYPEVYRACTEYAKEEKLADARPELQGKVSNMASYDTVFVGFPNWWGTAPMAIWTFLESYDFAGKTVIPFCTHGGGGEQNCFSDFAKHLGNGAQTKKGFICNGGTVDSARPKVEAWLKETGLL